MYIGCHITNDLDDDYIGSGKLLKRAVTKYGKNNFKKENLHIFDNKEEMFAMEKFLVTESVVKDSNYYNLKQGGYGGWYELNQIYRVNDTRDKTKAYAAAKEKMNTFENHSRNGRIQYERKIGLFHPSFVNNSFLGKHHSPESKKKIGSANSIHQSGAKNSQHGTCWITHPEQKQNKKIPKIDLEFWLQSGWQAGRVMNYVAIV